VKWEIPDPNKTPTQVADELLSRAVGVEADD
jgi:hypothetical protein